MKPGVRAGAAALAALSFAAVAQPVARPDPLLTVERARAAIVERVVATQQAALSPPATAALRERLWSARADRLLGASFAGTIDGFNGNAARHMGPMAQDFWAAFGLGDGDTTISHVDVQGVTLAAVQGLHAQITERDRRIDALERRIDALRDDARQIEALRAGLEALRAALTSSSSEAPR
ncbi:MAG: hypothetical protein ABIR52_02315 [Casimicrobiaceae bacterium]